MGILKGEVKMMAIGTEQKPLVCAECLNKIPPEYDGCPACSRKKRDAKLSSKASDGGALIASGILLVCLAVLMCTFIGFVATNNLEATSDMLEEAKKTLVSLRALYWGLSALSSSVLMIPGVILIAAGAIQSSLKKIHRCL